MTLVYSTQKGRIKPEKEKLSVAKIQTDGIVRLWLETKGRKGSGVVLIKGLDLNDLELKTLAANLKKLCGCGGSVKGDVIEIQGNMREKIKIYLEKQGMKVKLAGG